MRTNAKTVKAKIQISLKCDYLSVHFLNVFGHILCLYLADRYQFHPKSAKYALFGDARQGF